MSGYSEWEASELFCPKCKQPRKVKKRMLLALPGGDKYDYVCSVCGTVAGGKMDKKDDNFGKIIIG